MTPTLDEIQQTIKQLIGLVLDVSKGVSWQQEYSQDSTKNKGNVWILNKLFISCSFVDLCALRV